MILPAMNTASIPSDLTFSLTEFTISDGESVVAGGYPLPQTWPTESEAAEAMARMCWHPRRYAGPFRVIPVTVVRTKYETTLSVSA